MKQRIIEFYSFLKNPKMDITCQRKNRIADVFLALAFCLSGVIISITLLSILPKELRDKVGVLKVAQFTKYSKTYIFILIVFLGPLVEEIGFRLLLLKKKFFFTISMVFIYVCLKKIYFIQWGIYNFTFFVLGLIIVAISAYCIENFTSILGKIYSQYYGLLFYFFAVFFAIIHIKNFTQLENHLYLAPIVVFPQFFDAIVFGYFRLKNGFFFSLLIHSIINFFGSLLLLLK